MNTLFFLKKFFGLLLLPLPIIIGLLIIGLILLWATRRRITAQLILAVATILLLLTSYSIFPDAALRRLENLYPPLDEGALPGCGMQTVVVLGGGHYTCPGLSPLTRLSPDSLIRLMEGIRIYRQLPGARLLLSGGRISAPEGDAEAMAQAAVTLGVDPAEIVLENVSLDTKDEARIIKTMLGSQPFILVTSAYHMPRSMALFTAQGMRPLPAPVGHLARCEKAFALKMFFPCAEAIDKAETALHEILGLLSAGIMGQL